jgi:polyferredoxin
LLTGPAWCSFLCYIGSWDNSLAKRTKLPKPLTEKKTLIRILLFSLVAVTALVFRVLGVSGSIATGLGLTFGIIGVGVMVAVSRKKGVMVHCVSYCPIGLAANWLGRLSPFRIRINASCTDCMACRSSCRYDALNRPDIIKRQPGLTCTLCGDCIGTCQENALQYRFLRLKSQTARTLFYVLIVSFHAVFLGVARL